ncbi:hypothetical protein ACKC5Q_23650, partial [Aeromonas dhakensis]|uniref:hypothetical protein n=1 Tax=Aeromonas dhakensis TaxID=196024 RepID=UPI0038B58312
LSAINLAVLGALLIWSLARRWPFPPLWPRQWSGRYWFDLLPTNREVSVPLVYQFIPHKVLS